MEEPKIDTSVDFLITTMQNVQSSDTEVREPASQFLLMLEDNYPVDLFSNCAQIVLEYDERVERSIIKCALIELQRILDHKRFGFALRELWVTLEEDLKVNIRSAVVRGLLFEPEIVKIAACVFAKLFNVDYDELKAGEYIHTFLSTPAEYNDDNMAAALYAVAELVDPQNRVFDEDHFNQLNEDIPKFGDDILNYLHEIMSHSIPFGNALLDAVKGLIVNCMPMIKESPLIPDLMTILPQLFPACQDPGLFDKLFQVLYSIVIQTYDMPEMYGIVTVESIVELGTLGLSVSEEFLKSVVIYWVELLTWEKKREEANLENLKFAQEYREKIKSEPTFLKIPKQMCYRKIGEKAAEEIHERIIDLVAAINPEDTEPEDIENPEICMYACSILKNLFFFNPGLIFEKVKATYESASAETENWTVHHAKVIIPYVLCNPLENPLPHLREFILSTTNFLVEVILNEETVPRVVESALYSLYQIQKNYENIRTMEQVSDLMSAFSIQQKRHPIIALRCLVLIEEIIRKSKSISAMFNTELESPVFTIVGEVIDFYPDNEEILRNAYLTLFLYIKMSADNVIETMQPRIPTILEDLNTLLTQTLDEKIQRSPSLHYTLVQTKLWLITGIFRRFGSNLSDVATSTADKLFELMHAEGAEQWHEDILTTLLDVILALPSSNLTVKETLSSYIPYALQSGNPSLVNATIMAVSYIFQRFHEEVYDMYSNTLDLIFQLLDDETYPSERKPEILAALSRIIGSIPEGTLCTDRQNLFEKIDSYLSIPFRTDTPEEILFVNNMYASIYLNYTSLIKTMKPDNPMFERQVYKNLIFPLKKLAQLPKIEEDTIWSVLQFLEVAVTGFGRKGNIFLNYHCNYFICIWGIVSSNLSLREFSKKVLRALRES